MTDRRTRLQGYCNFAQTSDDEVVALLDRAREGFREPEAAGTPGDPPVRKRTQAFAGQEALVPTGVVLRPFGAATRRATLGG